MKKSWAVWAVLPFLFYATLACADGLSDLERLLGKPVDSLSLPASDSVSALADVDNKIIRLTPDKTRILRLDRDAASVIVTNPAHAAVMMDSPRLLVVMPREPGTTAFTVLDSRGAVLMEKSVIVTAAQPQYVRVRRSCSGDDQACVASAYFYCPDGCYEVTPVAGDGATSNVPEVAGNSQPAEEPR